MRAGAAGESNSSERRARAATLEGRTPCVPLAPVARRTGRVARVGRGSGQVRAGRGGGPASGVPRSTRPRRVSGEQERRAGAGPSKGGATGAGAGARRGPDPVRPIALCFFRARPLKSLQIKAKGLRSQARVLRRLRATDVILSPLALRALFRGGRGSSGAREGPRSGRGRTCRFAGALWGQSWNEVPS